MKKKAQKSEDSVLQKSVVLLPSDSIAEIFARFRAQNGDPKTELIAPNPFTLLVSVVLSAQATDKSVNAATAPLYKKVTTPAQMLALGETELIGYIKSIGLYKSKAAHVMALSAILAQKYGANAGGCSFDQIAQNPFPRTREAFEELPGVGRKTANVMLNVLYGEPTMPVDTHLLRIAPRMGLSAQSTPLGVERDLLARIPREFLTHAHHWLILHGRYVCTARKPLCETCLICDVCPKNGIAD